MGFIKREWTEAKEASIELGGFLKRHDYKKSAKSLFSFKNWGMKLSIIIIVVGTTLLSIYHKQIVTAFEPKKELITSKPWTWSIPVLLLIIVSFPPLFGHEVIILVVGLIWGLGIGFAIAAAGTFLGEMACFFAFKYYFVEKARKIEEESLLYASLARMMRNGGLGMLVLVRFSALPGHVVSAVQAAIGTNVLLYSIAVFVSLPKQFAIVYLGVIFGVTAGPNTSPSALNKERYISLAVFALTALVSIVAFFFIWTRARRYYQIIEEERKLKGIGLEEGEIENGNVSERIKLSSGSNGNDEINRDGYGGGYTSQSQQYSKQQQQQQQYSSGGPPNRENWTGFEEESRNENYHPQQQQGGENVPIYNNFNSVSSNNSNSPFSNQHQSNSYDNENDDYENDLSNSRNGPKGFLGAGGSNKLPYNNDNSNGRSRDVEAMELSVSRERLLEEDRLERERRGNYQSQQPEYQTQSQSSYRPQESGVVQGGIPYRMPTS